VGQQRANPSAAAVQAASNKSAAASSSSTPSRTNSNGAASSSSAAAASSSPAAIRPAAPVRESKWGPPASSRPPPGWAVPDNLQHIVDGTSASSNGVANGVKAASSAALQPFQYLLVLDFEATCDERKDDEPRFEGQEIIEFPMVLVNTQTGEVEAEFHQYVTPVIHKQLTPFCTELTGITQKMVSPESGAKPFAEVWRMVIAFLEKHHLIPSTDASSSSSSSEVVHPFAIVTCGDWDLKTMLLLQFSHTFGSHSSSSEVPRCFRSWINIKHAYNNHYKPKTQARGMTDLLSQLRLPLEGRHHSGIDDSRNITSVAKRMLQDGWIARYTKQEKMGPRAGGQQQQNGHGVTPAANGAASASSGARQPSALQAALRKNQGSSKTPSAQ
jgi:ERI1 exoribonuclease 3